MLTSTANGNSRLSFWLRVREFAVPPSMIETATARRHAGDWAGACAAAGVDVDLQLRAAARTYGRELTARLRADLRHLAPDLLRWHMPRIAPDGLLRPGLTLTLARYDVDDGAGRGSPRPLHLVARTPPAWADAGQRISLALWDGDGRTVGVGPHPHPRPHRRHRLDLHRHLWDARRTAELRARSGADRPETGPGPQGAHPGPPDTPELTLHPDLRDAPPLAGLPHERRRAVRRWADEAQILLRAEGRSDGTGTVVVRSGARQRLLLDVVAGDSGPPTLRIGSASKGAVGFGLPVLPEAATWELPDLELLRSGAIEADRLHPLVASALVPGHTPSVEPRPSPDRAGAPRLVECRGVTHRIGLVDGTLAPFDHDPDELRREELLVALTGTPLPCLQAVDEAHRRPDCLTGVRERLDHGDIAGALAVVEGLLGPDAVVRDGPLREALEEAALRRITYGLYRAGLSDPGADRLRKKGRVSLRRRNGRSGQSGSRPRSRALR
ncbi:hypothetical protein ABZ330_22240 [Streptomyces sp. NPDC006172]|uniref:hypothetical protein n=1 Tax=Streptomyces sp. NPDC006172 TaxID=3154470 RepID=UPI0033E0C892